VALEGDQCLVFFLGGIPIDKGNGTYAMDGFGKNPQNPAAAPRGGPTFDFKSSRLRARGASQFQQYGNAAGDRGFPSFFDPYYGEAYPASKPYAYFSAFGRKNISTAMVNGGFGYLPRSSAFHDCGTLACNIDPVTLRLGDVQAVTGTFFVPYRDSNATYYQSNGFQIISAGPDQNFGVGGLAPSANTALGRPDADNVTQFSNGQISNIGN
jgi:general secretion pathway protein G